MCICYKYNDTNTILNLKYLSFKEMLTKHLLIGFVMADISWSIFLGFTVILPVRWCDLQAKNETIIIIIIMSITKRRDTPRVTPIIILVLYAPLSLGLLDGSDVEVGLTVLVFVLSGRLEPVIIIKHHNVLYLICQ